MRSGSRNPVATARLLGAALGACAAALLISATGPLAKAPHASASARFTLAPGGEL
jgi:hypothetical protein